MKKDMQPPNLLKDIHRRMLAIGTIGQMKRSLILNKEIKQNWRVGMLMMNICSKLEM